MEFRTFYSDETQYYRIPAEPDPGDTVRIRFRTGRYQADDVSLFCIKKDTFSESVSANLKKEGTRIQMNWAYEKNNFDYYEAEILVSEVPFYYYFTVMAEGCTFLYDKIGVNSYERHISPFILDPGYHTPEWSKGCLYYQIFPDRFCNSDLTDDVRTDEYHYGGRPVVRSEWGEPVMTDTYRQFYGGDLPGIIEKLPYLKSLGIEAIYLNPIFASPSSHKYDCCDYEHVDMGLGRANDEKASDEILAELIAKAHKNGMRVILDGVFNHCSSAHKWFGKNRRKEDDEGKNGAYGNPESPYHNRFTFFDKECTDYEAWWGVKTLPKLNYEGDESLTEEICRIGQKWVSAPYYADGWRLDVAADLAHSEEANHCFWNAFRSAVRDVNPDALILAEHYEDPSPWLNSKEWDSIMNYNAFMDPVSYFFTGMEKHSDAAYPDLKGNAEVFAEALTYHSSLLPDISLLSSLNQLDNHDHSRFLTRTNGLAGRVEKEGTYAAGVNVDVSVLRQAAGFLYFWPGSPGLYYGDEAGVCGFTDPDNRRCFPWNKADKELVWYFEGLGRLRAELSFIKTASTRILYAEDGVFAFARFTDRFAATVVVSQSDEDRTIDLPLWMSIYPGYEQNRVVQCVLQSDGKGYSFERKPYIVHYGICSLNIHPGELIILT